jgi:hypothetical protein
MEMYVCAEGDGDVCMYVLKVMEMYVCAEGDGDVCMC